MEGVEDPTQMGQVVFPSGAENQDMINVCQCIVLDLLESFVHHPLE